ncbi:MAG: hypothetical protein ACXV9Q_02420 [Chthoniobacterales bacterium]
MRPDLTADQVALALSALQFKKIELAEDALEAVPSTDRDTAEYHVAAGRLAEMRGSKDAETHWARAVELAPENSAYQLQLALVRLPDPARHETGRAMLEELRANGKERAAVTRALIKDKIARNELAGPIRDLARELQSYPDAAFSDRLLYLDILHQMNDPAFTSYVTDVENVASANPGDLAGLLSWMNRNSLSSLAIDFSRTRPSDDLAKWPVPLALAESFSNMTDWKALEQLTQEGNWGTFEFLRHAFLARAMRLQDKSAPAAREWEIALKDASDDAEQLLLLARTVSEWRWDSETEELLWQMSRRLEIQNEALRTLYRRYSETSDTAGLHRVLARLAEINPSDLVVQNNLALTALLLNIDLPLAAKAAAALYEEQPSNAAYATTYAFALYKTDKIPQALQVLGSVKEGQLQDPSVSLYYGVILVAAGEKERARPFLERAGTSSSMLAEEKLLLSTAQKKANYP